MSDERGDSGREDGTLDGDSGTTPDRGVEVSERDQALKVKAGDFLKGVFAELFAANGVNFDRIDFGEVGVANNGGSELNYVVYSSCVLAENSGRLEDTQRASGVVEVDASGKLTNRFISFCGCPIPSSGTGFFQNVTEIPHTDIDSMTRMPRGILDLATFVPPTEGATVFRVAGGVRERILTVAGTMIRKRGQLGFQESV